MSGGNGTGAALAVVPPRAGSSMVSTVRLDGMRDVFAYARALANAGSGIVPKAYAGNENAIAACIVTGAELGIGAMEALRSIYIVDGKPQLAADLMMRIAIQRGITIEWVELTDKKAHAKFRRPGFPDHVCVWTWADAERAGLTGKDVWKKYPRAMLRSRCVSEALRAWAPDVLGAGVYAEGEISDRTIDMAPVSPPTQTAPIEGQVVDRALAADAARTPEQLDKCTTPEVMRAWCVERAAKMHAMKGAERNRAKAAVTARAGKLGIDVAIALEWAGLADASPEPTPHDPATGEVLTDEQRAAAIDRGEE